MQSQNFLLYNLCAWRGFDGLGSLGLRSGLWEAFIRLFGSLPQLCISRWPQKRWPKDTAPHPEGAIHGPWVGQYAHRNARGIVAHSGPSFPLLRAKSMRQKISIKGRWQEERVRGISMAKQSGRLCYQRRLTEGKENSRRIMRSFLVQHAAGVTVWEMNRLD
jgi:hypothetical protein